MTSLVLAGGGWLIGLATGIWLRELWQWMSHDMRVIAAARRTRIDALAEEGDEPDVESPPGAAAASEERIRSPPLP